MKRLAIIGGGGWGTALAVVLSPRFPEIRLWVYERDIARHMGETRQNEVFLPGICIPPNVSVVTEFAEALEGAGAVLGVMPSHAARSVYSNMLPHLDPAMVFVIATKGIENGSLLRMSEVICEVVGSRFAPRVAVLSGPTFAREVARGDPTALVIASGDQQLAESIQVSFSGPTFRLYTNSDPVGVELGASLKNVIAIAAGVCQGLGLGNNTVAALITRGLAEITRLAIGMGGRPSTLAGLAGLGDLVLTCTGELSRNRQVGIELGRGRQLDEVIGSMRMVAEGVKTAESAVGLSDKYGIDLPIMRQIHAILYSGRSPREAVRELMERSLKGE